MDVLIPYIIFLICFILINIVGYGIALLNTKESIYKELALYWCAVLLIVLTEGAVTEGTLGLSLIFIVNLPAIYILSRFILRPHDYKLNLKFYLAITPLLVALSVVLSHFNFSGPIVSLPVTSICALPFLEVLYALFVVEKNKAGFEEKVLGATVALFGIACVANYGINRFDPTPLKNFIGFGSALLCYLSYSILLPIFCFQRLNKEKMIWLKEQVNLKTNELLESRNEKEKLLAVLIHDVSNPLMAANHNIKIATQKDKNERLSSALRSLESINSVIEHVRKYEIASRKKNAIPLQEVFLAECLLEIKELFRDRFEEKNITLIIQNNLPLNYLIKVDKTSFIHSVASNLISNALKFSPPSSEVRVICFEKDYEIGIKVIDNGIGMSQDIISNIFNASNSISRKGTNGEMGTAFGLPIANSYVSSFGGRIEVSSSQGADDGGTTFSVYLPKVYTGNSNQISQ